MPTHPMKVMVMDTAMEDMDTVTEDMDIVMEDMATVMDHHSKSLPPKNEKNSDKSFIKSGMTTMKMLM